MAGVNLNKARERLEKHRKQKEDRKKMGDFFNLEDGENLVRFMPPWSDSGEFIKEAWYHYNMAEKPVLCPKKTFGEGECAICDFVDSLFRTKDADDKKAAKERMAKVRYSANVLNLKEKDPAARKRVRVMHFGSTIYEELLGYINDPDYGDFTDPSKGMDVKIERSGEGLETKYTVRVRRQASAVEAWQEVSQNIIDLDARVESERLTVEDLASIVETGELPTKTETKDEADPEEAAETPAATPTPTATKEAEDDGFGAPTKATETKAAATAPAKTETKSKLESQMERLRKRAGK